MSNYIKVSEDTRALLEAVAGSLTTLAGIEPALNKSMIAAALALLSASGAVELMSERITELEAELIGEAK